MENCWTEISSDQKFLDIDKIIIEEHNKKYDESHHNHLQVKLWPEPFIGNKDANIFLLLANPLRPGIEEEKKFKDIQDRLIVKDIILNNLKHVLDEYPFYYLNPENHHLLGYGWWNRCFSSLKEEFSSSKLSKEFFTLELLGYPSWGLPKMLLNKLPSIHYSKYLINDAIEKDKIIIICRSTSNWFSLVPKLMTYSNCHLLAKNRTIELSKYTISPPVWNRINQILKGT